MFFLGTNIIGGSNDSVPLTPTSVDNMTSVTLKNGMYDCLYITKETTSEPSGDCPKNWDHDTIFHADFNNSTHAGNVDWNLKSVSHTIIRRRNTSDFKWMTIAVKEIHSLKDFTDGMKIVDYMAAGNVEYEYAVVPVLNGTPGIPNSTFVKSEFNNIFLAEKNQIICMPASNGFCDTTRVVPSSIVTTIKQKYPTYIRNSNANYDKGTCKGKFLELDEEACEFILENGERVRFQKNVIDFLSDGYPKILKHFDGRIWLIEITGEIQDTADSVYNNRDIYFEWTEIGNCNSEEDLYYADLTDVTEEWWDT